MAGRVCAPGESADACRKRVMQECRAVWNSAGFSEERVRWSAKAKAMNKLRSRDNLSCVQHDSAKDGKSRSVQQVVQRLTEETAKSVPMLALTPAALQQENVNRPKGFGVFCLGDADWAISLNDVEKADMEPAFVSSYSSAWKRRSSDMVNCPQVSSHSSYRMSCLECYGFCMKQISDLPTFRSVESKLVDFIRNHRQSHLEHGRNTGPKVTVQHPMLLLARDDRLGNK